MVKIHHNSNLVHSHICHRVRPEVLEMLVSGAVKEQQYLTQATDLGTVYMLHW